MVCTLAFGTETRWLNSQMNDTIHKVCLDGHVYFHSTFGNGLVLIPKLVYEQSTTTITQPKIKHATCTERK